MLRDHLVIDAIYELTPHKAAEFCEGALDGERLVADVEDFAPFGRKGLCEYLDIGESTLSGWLKQDRIPRMAKEAYVLLAVTMALKEEVQRLRREADDLKILKNGDVYQICVFREDADGLPLGRVVADGIQDVQQARLMATSIKALRMLDEATGVIDEMLDRTENEAYIGQLEGLKSRITEHVLSVCDPEKYRQFFPKVFSDEDFLSPRDWREVDLSEAIKKLDELGLSVDAPAQEGRPPEGGDKS